MQAERRKRAFAAPRCACRANLAPEPNNAVAKIASLLGRQDRSQDLLDALIEDGRLFLWLDGDDKVAMCSYGISGEKGSINNVFTRPDMRRKGYAANIVYQVTKIVEAQDKLPVLYTDADYAASNACYEGIGYIKQGSLCTVE